MPKISDTKIIMTPELIALVNQFSPEEIETGFLKTRPGTSAGIPLDVKGLRGHVQSLVEQATIGELLERARKEKGETQTSVGKKLGVTRGRMSQRENAKSLPLRDVVLQADALGYDVRLVLEPRDGGKSLEARLPH